MDSLFDDSWSNAGVDKQGPHRTHVGVGDRAGGTREASKLPAALLDRQIALFEQSYPCQSRSLRVAATPGHGKAWVAFARQQLTWRSFDERSNDL